MENDWPAEPIECQDIPEDNVYHETSPLQKYMRKTPWWATSVAFHGLIILCLYLIQWGVIDDKGKDIPMVTEIARQEEKLEEKDEEKIFEKKDLVRDTVEKDLPEVDDVVIDRVFEEKIASTDAVGDPDMLGDVDLGGDGKIGTMGLGGGGMSGLFGSRGGGKKRAVAKYGGKGTLTAVDRGLEWLKRHQCPDGGWGPQDYADQCKGPNTRCKQGTGSTNNKSHGAKSGLTGLAVMAFLGAGYTHRSGKKYRKTVKKGIDFILNSQTSEGAFGRGWIGYTNGICTLALAEAYGMTKDPKLKAPLERAVQNLLKTQQPNGGWLYGGGDKAPFNGDTSVSAFMLMALKDSQISGIKADFDKAYKTLDTYFNNVCIGTHKGLATYRSPSAAKRHHSMTGIVLMCRQFMGKKKKSPMLKESAEYLSN